MRPAVLLLALGLTVGCSSQQESPALPVPTTSPTPSATAYSPAPLPEPVETGGVDAEVERAVLAYFRGINRLLATGDPSEFDASYTADCAPCAAFSKSVVDIYAKGQRAVDARDEVQKIEVAPGNSADAGAATVSFRVPAYRIVDAQGAEVGSYPASGGTRIFTVARTAGVLKVVSIQDAS